ncbi:VanZ family protein [Brevibacillus fluminis]|uniref:VanZ family protein n=1 Tax=Brevibacillus fluminis TaxID=511487 RepID=UPI003F89204A
MLIEQYVESIVRKLPCSNKEKANLKDELYDHLLSLQHEFIEEGADAQMAAMLAIQRFGDSERIAADIAASLPLVDPYRRRWFLAAFIGYVAGVVYLLFFSEGRWHRHAMITAWKQKMLAYGLPEYTKLNQNTVPLRTIIGYVTHHQDYAAATILYNTAGNVLLFMPFGFLLPLLFTRLASIHRVFFASLAASLALEWGQLLFSMGSFDVDDMLLNTIGALGGFGLYTVWQRWRKRQAVSKQHTTIEGSS